MRGLKSRPSWRKQPHGGLRMIVTIALILSSPSSFSSDTTVCASDVDNPTTLNEDHNHHRLNLEQNILDLVDSAAVYDETSDDTSVQYEADFLGYDAGILGRRALVNHKALPNNDPDKLNIQAGEVNLYEVDKSVILGPFGDPGRGLPSVPFTNASTRSQLAEGDAPPADSGEAAENILDTRQADGNKVVARKVFISINTCLQPKFKKGEVKGDKVPQLTLYVSTTSKNSSPGPGKERALQRVIPLDEGYAATSVMSADQVFISVAAPNVSVASGVWAYELAASIDDYYHGYDEFQRPGKELPLLLNVDTDSSSALLVTQNLTNASSTAETNRLWLENGNPFTLFAFPSKNADLFNGVRKSFCGLQLVSGAFKVNSNNTVTTRGLGGLPKGQFHLQNLQSGTSYVAMMAMDGNSTASGPNVVGGGGAVWPNISLATNPANSSCSLLFDLKFCTEVAYSVPSNPSNLSLDLPMLSNLYDTNARALFQNFTYSMQQVPCNTTDSARYSLVAGCDNCTAAYKDWLCAVAIPRCQDLRADALGDVVKDANHNAAVVDSMALMPRNLGQPFPNGSRLKDLVGDDAPLRAAINQSTYANLTQRVYANSSRNPLIDADIRPGPYMEFLPCEDLCFALVRMCPASLGFACPRGNGLRRSYGRQGQCNSPGAVFVRSSGVRTAALRSAIWIVWAAALLVLS